MKDRLFSSTKRDMKKIFALQKKVRGENSDQSSLELNTEAARPGAREQHQQPPPWELHPASVGQAAAALICVGSKASVLIFHLTHLGLPKVS